MSQTQETPVLDVVIPTLDAAAQIEPTLAALAEGRGGEAPGEIGPRQGLIREILRPILREWLDQNLPYLIERLVKKEIDHMVNKAERLDL